MFEMIRTSVRKIGHFVGSGPVQMFEMIRTSVRKFGHFVGSGPVCKSGGQRLKSTGSAVYPRRKSLNSSPEYRTRSPFHST